MRRVEDEAGRRVRSIDVLWQAKMALKQEGHSVRDWAGWVLTGSPD